MPVPGTRDQFRDGTVRNPDGERMLRFEYTPYHGIADEGRSPGLMERTLRGCVLAAGQIRQLWRQSVNFSDAQAPYSWTDNSPQPDRPATLQSRGFEITRALRYMTRSTYAWAGTDNTRLSELHTVIVPQVRYKQVTTGGGQRRYPPTVRNRLSSFGSRVPPINRRVQAAEEEG
jgi:hypothetical protein